jgi:uncharacterized 2Fe-2S/4Fe-4S cluster protein (DUF4445 family)
MTRARRPRSGRSNPAVGVKPPRVTFLPAGVTSTVAPGTTLFHAAAWTGQPVDSACGGRGTCGKCRVRIDRGPKDVTPADLEHLGAAEIASGWRLSCRVEVRSTMTVEVPRLLRAARSAPLGAGRGVLIDPNVHKVHLRLEKPQLEDQRPDRRRLEDALAARGFKVEAELPVLRTLPGTLRRADFDVTAVLCGATLVAVEPGDTTREAFGVALDLGTTTMVGALLDLSTGASRAVASAQNPQAIHGADVLTRISHTMSGDGGLHDLQRLAAEAINGLVAELTRRSEVPLERVYEITVAGNVVMLHLLMGIDPEPIATTPFTPAVNHGLSLPARSLGVEIHPRGMAYLLPGLGAYVGGDIVAGLLATGLPRDPRLRLFVDVGTNGEIALGSERRALATAAPAGPAFEGAEIACGMRATSGAIESVRIGADEVLLRTIDDASPAGLCGSGLIDTVAQLYRRGLLDATGRLLSCEDARGRFPTTIADRLVTIEGVRAFVVATERQTGSAPVVLTQKDVRQMQVAKGSIATGIQVLMREMGVGPADIEEVLLAGAFGSYIRPESARAIGLVPPVDLIRAVGNAAGEGARIALLSYRERQAAEAMPAHIGYLELSGRADFNELFLQALGFPPLDGTL